MSTSLRLAWVDRMRGIAILSVVVQHLSNYFLNDFTYHKIIGISNMAVFFFISGYIWNKTSRIEGMSDALRFLLKKTIQLFLPLLVWNLLSPLFFSTDWSVLSFNLIVEKWKDPHLWFLLTLYSYAFYFVVFKLVSKWGGGRIDILFWFIALAALFVVWFKFGLFKLATLYIIYFAFGTLCQKYGELEKLLSNRTLIFFAFVVVLLFTAFWSSGSTSIRNIFIKMAVSFAVIAITYLVCSEASWNKSVDFLIQRYGRCSLAIYILHWPFIRLGERMYIVQNELIALLAALLLGIVVCEACLLLKNVVSLSPAADLILFGSKPNK